jgi:hypothetical protein
MGKPKTDQQVKDEIKKLREMKPFVRQFNSFGDSNHELIDCEIQALESDMDEDETYEEWPEGEADMEKRSSAQRAIEWRNGDEDESPSKGWEALDSRKKKT